MRGFGDCGVTEDRLAKLREAAQRARAANYSPYSGFIALAAVETAEGFFGGTNVENVNYTLTRHAEETAILAAILAGSGPAGKWVRTLYVTGASPCGSCRQFVAEFAAPDAVVLIDRIGQEQVRAASLSALSGDMIEAWSMDELLPVAFGPEEIGAG